MENFDNILQKAVNRTNQIYRNKGRIFPDLTAEQFVNLFKTCGCNTLAERNIFDEDFTIDDDNKSIANLFFKYIKREDLENINQFAGIILNGAYGCGKSVFISTLCKTLNLLHSEWKQPIQEIHAIDLAEQIRISGVLPFSRIPLCIQDLGKEPDMVNTFGQKYNPIANLLAIRAEIGVLTYGSTNMDLKTFEKFYGESIGKRITEHVNIIFLPGKSRRKNHAINQPKK